MKKKDLDPLSNNHVAFNMMVYEIREVNFYNFGFIMNFIKMLNLVEFRDVFGLIYRRLDSLEPYLLLRLDSITLKFIININCCYLKVKLV